MENILRKKKMLDRLPLGQKFLFYSAGCGCGFMCDAVFNFDIYFSISFRLYNRPWRCNIAFGRLQH